MRKIAAAVGLAVLAACAQATSSPLSSSPSPNPFSQPTTWGLYVSDGDSFNAAWHLIQLDAGTLKDAQARVPAHGFALASADASMLAEIDYKVDQSATVHIVDVRTGAEKLSFKMGFSANATLTADGSHLLVSDVGGRSWRVFDTTTGKQTGRIETFAPPGCCGGYFYWSDRTGRFLYQLLTPGSGFGAKAPITPVLVGYDLQVGREVGRQQLDGIQAGQWETGRKIGSEPVLTGQDPGVALSPDGSRLSILYNNGSQLMTIDTATMKIMSSRHLLSQKVSTNWFGLMPLDAAAKYDEGIEWNMSYSPDGRHLIAGARQTTIDNAGNWSTHGLGIKLIDLANGTVVAQLPDVDVSQFLYAPDGSAIYATSFISTGPQSSDLILLRLDPTNLAVGAKRTFPGYRTVLLLAKQ